MLKAACNPVHSNAADEATKNAHNLLINKIIASNVVADLIKDVPNGGDIKEQLKTGYLTDTGFALGCYLRGYKEDGHKIIFYMASIACFLVGGLLTYIWLNHSAISMILVLSLAYLLTGTYYFILRHCHQAA